MKPIQKIIKFVGKKNILDERKSFKREIKKNGIMLKF